MSAPAAELDVAQALCTGLSLVMDTDVKCGPRRSPKEPANAGVTIWVAPTGGRTPQPYLAAAASGSLFYPSVQVLVLGPPDDYEAGLIKARSARDALHCKAPSAAALAAYSSCLVRESDPLYLGPTDEDGRPQFALNVDLAVAYRAA